MSDFVRGSKGVFRPHYASVAHRRRAPARVDRRRAFGKSDFVQMTFSVASKKKHRFFCPKNRCFCTVWVLRVVCFLCLCPCVSCVCMFSVCVCVCACVCVCVYVCVFVSVCNPPCVRSTRPRICRQHAHMCFNMCAWCRHTRRRFERTHGDVLKGHTESREVTLRIGPRIFHRENKQTWTFLDHLNPCLIANFLLTMRRPTWCFHVPQRFTERNPWIIPISSLRTGPEKHVPESSNHSPCLTKLFSSSHLE